MNFAATHKMCFESSLYDMPQVSFELGNRMMLLVISAIIAHMQDLVTCVAWQSYLCSQIHVIALMKIVVTFLIFEIF